jgi:hypothetical protein
MLSAIISSRPPVDASRIAKRNADMSFYLFVAGAIAGLFQLFYPFAFGPATIEFGDGFEMVAVAKNLAVHGTFANPFFVENTGPTAVVPPLYPFLLAAPTKLLKRPELIAIIAVIGNISINALIAAWLPRVSVLFFGQSLPGVFGGLLWLATVRLMPSWDTSYTVFGLIVFCLLSSSWIERKSHPIRFGIAAGAIAGLLMLLNPTSVMVTLPWVMYLLLRQKAATRTEVGYCAVLIATLFLITSAWAARNHSQLGAFVVKTNLGMTLYASNNDCAEASLVEDMRYGCYQAHFPNISAIEARSLRTLGEVEYDRRRIADTRMWVARNAGRFRKLTLKRFWQFWFPPLGERPYMTYIIWLVTALSIPGLMLMAWRRELAALFIATVLLLYPLMYYVVVTDVRYRYPVLWLSLLPAGYFIAWVARRTTDPERGIRKVGG